MIRHSLKKRAGKYILSHAVIYLLTRHGTIDLTKISHKDYGDYCAIRIITALYQLHHFTEPNSREET